VLFVFVGGEERREERANPLSLSLSLGRRIRGRSVPVSSRRRGWGSNSRAFFDYFFFCSLPPPRDSLPNPRVGLGCLFGGCGKERTCWETSVSAPDTERNVPGVAGAVAPAMDSSGSRLSSANRHLRSSPPPPRREGGGTYDGFWPTLERAHPRDVPRVQFAFKDSMIHRILQFT
jgi:hypothetical protein